MTAIVGFTEIAFEIPPVKPKSLPLDWKQILEQWLLGAAFVRSTPTWSEIKEFLARSYF
ncbi:hypothetical protein [Hydrogenophaga crassostreae]|uniref:hypothetical protein n=1 Tax=Hydrogenophaga crassostreae TaxID=1763535 RepID=UPI000AEB57A2|nr:hypothetical protein [Hydrogenophaga crassostreae]